LEELKGGLEKLKIFGNKNFDENSVYFKILIKLFGRTG